MTGDTPNSAQYIETISSIFIVGTRFIACQSRSVAPGSLYQSPQCEAVICKNFIFHSLPCLTQTVLKC